MSPSVFSNGAIPLPGAAGVLRQSDPLNGNVEAAAAMVFANGAPVDRNQAGTVFCRDFAPWTCAFTVEQYLERLAF